MKLFIFNTNKSTDLRYEQEMIDGQKCAAYRSTKGDIEYIQKGDKVILYSNEVGIIARGAGDGEVKKKADNGILDDEYYMSLTGFYEYIKPIPNKKLVEILRKADPSFARPFNVTSLKFNSPASEEIWNEVNKYV